MTKWAIKDGNDWRGAGPGGWTYARWRRCMWTSRRKAVRRLKALRVEGHPGARLVRIVPRAEVR